MRILIVSEIFLPTHGGVPVAIAHLATSLVRDGHVVRIITTATTFRGGRVNLEQMDGYEVARVRSVPYPIDPANYRITVHPNKVVKKLIEEFKPDCIHFHSPWGALHNAAINVARKHHIPTVVTNHTMQENLTFNVQWAGAVGRKIAGYVMQWMAYNINKTDFMTAPTEMALDLFGRDRLKIPAKAVTNGVDTTWYSPDIDSTEVLKKLDIDPTARYFVSIGRLSGEKRIDMLLDAFAIVYAQDPSAQLLIAGKGPLRERLETQVQDLGLSKAVRFLGYVSDEEKRALLQHARTYVNPCPAELQCIVAMEALACGTSIIVADAGAVPELCESGKNGLIFHYPDIQDLAEKMLKLWQHPIAATTLKKAGREFIVQQHDTQAMVRTYVDVYRSLQKR